MSAPPLDPVNGFAELAAELVGRAVAASVAVEPEPGSQDEESAVKKVIIELSQLASAPGELVLKVTDEGVGLPHRSRSLCRALAPLERALASPAVRDGALLRTTGPTETEVWRYQVMSSAGRGIDIVAALPAPKPLGLRLGGTQATVTLDNSLVPPAAAAEVCDQLLSMLRVLCPPVQLELRCQDLLLQPASQEGDSTADSATSWQLLPSPAATSFNRLLAPFLSGTYSPAQRLKHGLLQEFQPPATTAAEAGSPPLLPPTPLTYVAVGDAPLPRGCKWGAAAGVVLRMPDHAALAAAAAARGGPSPQPPPPPAAQEEGKHPSAAAWVFSDHALQMSSNGTAAAALKRCDWAGHGFRLAAATPATPPPLGPLQLVLRCEQPGSGATIPLVVVRMYPLQRQEGAGPGAAAASPPPPPPPPPRYEALLVRGAVDAALAELRQLCPAVVAGRRDRSLARALPLVAAAAAGIMRRSVDAAAARQACAALGVGLQDLEAALLQRLKETVAAAEGAASQG